MESSKLFYSAVILALMGPLLAAAAPGVFDVFSWGIDQIAEGKVNTSPGAKSGEGTRSDRRCVCDGSWCRCCVDLSLAGYIEIGGPGCVDMRYISQEEGLKVNLTYGDTLLHGAQVKAGAANSTPICMDLLSDLAQVCATMKNLRKEGEGLRGCTSLEPILLGEAQEEYPLGCFSMDSKGIIPDPENSTTTESPEEEEEEEVEEAPETVTTTKPDPNEASFIAAVNAAAEDGIAWFSGFLGMIASGDSANSSKTNGTSSSPLESSETLQSSPVSSPSTILETSSLSPPVPQQQPVQPSSPPESYSEIP